MDTIASFGEWVKHRRRALRFTQTELAALVGCSVVLVRKIEADARRPSRQIAELLAQHLGLTAEQQALFVRSARAELAPFRLPAPHHPIHERPPRATEPIPALPAPPNELIGRALDVARVSELLGQATVRLVTLVGAPGVGKTRLALAGAWSLSRRFAHGAVFVALAPLAEAAQVLPAIARALDLHEQPGRPIAETLRVFLRHKQMLLVLDNFEHVLAAAPEVAALLAEAPRLTVLATSRAPLRLTSEHVYDVPPLAIDAAVSLFATRARQTWPAFELTDTNRADIVALAARLDHLPLAIELAAARARQFAPHELLAALERQLALLVDGPRDLPPRQQTLRDAIAWSYMLLDEDAKTLFRHLGVFVGGWSLEAAATVCQMPLAQTRAVLDVLVVSSLVQYQADHPGMARYGLLETLREFALEQLAETGEEQSTRRVHAAYFATLAERAHTELRGPAQWEWLTRLTAEQANLQAALNWTLAPPMAGDDERTALGVQLAGALSEFWDMSSNWADANIWMAQALKAAPHAEPELHARLLCGLALRVHEQDNNDLAIEYLDASAALYRAVGDQRGLAYATLRRALPTRKQGAYEQMHAALDASQQLFQQLGDQYGLAWVWFLRGLSAMDHGDYTQSERLFSDAVARFSACGSTFDAGWVHCNLGQTARFQRRFAQAQQHYDECLRVMRMAKSHALELMVQGFCGHLARERGDAAAALAIYRACLILMLEVGNRRHSADCLDGIADIARARGQANWAARMIGASAALREQIDVPIAPSERPGYDRIVAACRAALGDAGFETAWRAGQALSWEQSVDEALAQSAAWG